MSNTAMTELMALDLTRVPPTTRFIARLPSGHTAWATSLGRDRTLIASGSALFQIGIDDGSVVMLRPLPSDPRYSGVHTLCAYDPWTDHIIVGPLNELYSLLVHEGVLSSGSWRQWLYSPLEGLYKLTSTSEQPFELFGRGCPNSTGRDARVTARGLPLQGQTFSLDLRDGEPSAAGLLWLSMSDQFWAPVGTLPYEASALGAPGCTLLVAADIVYAIATNAGSSTALTLRVPINAALHQIELFAQGATSTNVNALTLATSDAIAIRVR
jgi:hypothetical protein